MVMMRPAQPTASRAREVARQAALVALVVGVALSGCGGESIAVSDDGNGDAGEGAESTGGFAGTTGLGGTGGKGGTSGMSGSSTGGRMTEPPDTNPGCPDTPPPPGFYECDVFGTPTGCGPDEGCYPTIEHPYGMGCDQQVHGSRCAFSGTQVQGEFCPGGTLDCAPGYICIVGAQTGSRCMLMCPLDGSEPCPTGLFCGETDAQGVGVCG
jgi:hypothetical protein